MAQAPLESLFEAVAGLEKLLILPHNDPDPDAIASAIALRYLLEAKLGSKADIAYYGIIGRAENKALISYLERTVQPIIALEDFPTQPTALVDTQPGAGNNVLAPDTNPVVVIDHHPWREGSAEARFADVRADLGATSTILTEYFQAAGLEPSRPVATALFYGIKTDTMGLSRKASPADAAAYAYLQPRIEANALVEIEQAQVPVDYFRSMDTALRAVRIYEDKVVIAYLGALAYPDLTAEMADLLLRLEGSEWVICMGIYQSDLILSTRARSQFGGAGTLAQAIVNAQGTAGGHGLMAGGHIPLDGRDPKNLARRLKQRALRYLNIAPNAKGRSLI